LSLTTTIQKPIRLTREQLASIPGPILQRIVLERTGKMLSTEQMRAIKCVTPGGKPHQFTFDDLRIETKESGVITFRPNVVQVAYLDILAPRWRAGDYGMRGKREILLKARQFGFSTLIAALFFLDTVNNRNRHTVVIAYDQKGTETLFRMVDRFYQNLDPERRPKSRFANTRILHWPSLDSSYEVLTAGTKASGRGSTISNLHMSEVAFWQYEEVVTGLLQAVPSNGNVFIETTANGEGNLFQREYQTASKGESTFEARFFAWWMHDEYRRTPPPDFKRTTALTETANPDLFARFGDEQELVDLYGLDDHQLYWRRCKIMEPGMGALFVQEYPANDVEAFRVSGNKFFTEFDEELHTIWPIDLPPSSIYFGAYDWGYGPGAASCFLLATTDQYGGVIITDELYLVNKTNKEQAQAVVDLLRSRGLFEKRILVAADDGMWQAKGRQEDGIGKSDVETFWGAGLNFVKANKDRRHGWNNMRQYLHDVHTVGGSRADGTLREAVGSRAGGTLREAVGSRAGKAVGKEKIPALRIFKRCVNLIRTIPLMTHDAHKTWDLDTTLEDHAVDTCRYLLNTRPRVRVDDKEKPKALPHALEDDPQEVFYEPS
jgi:hypothetical protein